VLEETIALLQRRIGLAAVRDLSELIVPVLSIEWVSLSLHQRGLDRLFHENRRNLSLVDCVSFEFMKSQGIQEALALDRDFEAAGYRLLP
jgi:predicted nucleic acid-binding protein